METQSCVIEETNKDNEITKEVIPENTAADVKEDSGCRESSEPLNTQNPTLTDTTQLDNKDQKQKSKKETKKKPEAKNKTNDQPSRPRAKTTTSVFESNLNKSKEASKATNKIVATGIGESKFNNLLSMFDKNKNDKSNEPQQHSNEEKKSSANKLDMTKLSTFTSGGTSEKKNSAEIEIKPSLSIKERMELLKKESERTSAKGNKVLDPILEMNKVKEKVDDDNDNDEEEEDLDISNEEEVEEKQEKDDDGLDLDV